MQDVTVTIRAINKASGAIKEVQKDLSKMSESVNHSSFAFQYLQFQGFAGLMAIQYGLYESVMAGFEFNKQMELMLMRWTNMTGSAAEGQKIVDMMNRIVKDTSMSTSQISQFAMRLTQAGIPVEDLESKLYGLANVQAKYGLTNDEAGRFVLGFTQALSKGKLQAEEMNQMLEAGVPIYQILQEEFGWTREELSGLGKDSEKTQKALEFLNGEFLEGTQFIEAYGETTEGIQNRLTDAWIRFWGVLQQDIFERIKGYMKEFSTYLEEVTMDIEEGAGSWDAIMSNMSEKFRKAVEALILSAQLLASAGIAIQILKLGNEVSKAASNFSSLTGILMKLPKAAYPVIGFVALFVLAIMNLVKWYYQLRDANPELEQALESLYGLFSDFAEMLSSFVSPAIKFISGQFDDTSEKVFWVIDAIRAAIVIFGAFAITVGAIVDIINIFLGVLGVLFVHFKLTIGMVGALNKAFSGDFKGALSDSKSAMEDFTVGIEEANGRLAKAMFEEGWASKMATSTQEALDGADLAWANFEARMKERNPAIEASVTGVGDSATDVSLAIRNASKNSVDAVNSQAAGVESASDRQKTAFFNAKTKVLAEQNEMINKANESSTKISKSMDEVSKASEKMADGVTTNAPKVGTAMGQARRSAEIEASKLPPEMLKQGKNSGSNLATGIGSKSGSVRSNTKTAADAGSGYLKGLDWSSFGSSVMSTFASGIRAKYPVVSAAVDFAVGMARKLLPSSDAKKGPLSDLTYSGTALVSTFANGIYKQAYAAGDATSYVAQQARRSLETELGVSMFGQQQTITIYHQHNGTVSVEGETSQQANQFVSQSIGYEIGADGVKRLIRGKGRGY